jgi:probable rRNA maturation factor
MAGTARRNARKNPPPDPAQPPGPALVIANRQRTIRLDLRRIRRLAALALPACLETPGPGEASLPALAEVNAAIVPARTIADAHLRFLGIAGPTDVLTFPYGEILVCAEVAAEFAREYGQSVDDEVALYIIHGLLHLNGYEDSSPDSARRMRARQAKVLKRAQERV